MFLSTENTEGGEMNSFLRATDLTKYYRTKRGFQDAVLVKAVDGVSFEIQKGRTLGIVGESGSGKSTLGRLVMQIEPPTSGTIEIDGKNVKAIANRDYRKRVQMIFQDPYGSLNPRKKAGALISEPLRINTDLSKAECHERAIEMMKKVGLRAEYANRYPHMFSGGQRQRIGIARALILHPEIVVCDEPVSALDVSIQAQVINLLMELQDSMGLTYIFISHDLDVVRHIADDVLVMNLGKAVEFGNREKIFSQPEHPYTQTLLAATPRIPFACANVAVS
jgi:dipeptide transport system ATP-binding protein